MDYKKVNQLTLKNYYAKDSIETPYGIYKDKIAICDHGHRVLLIPAKEFIFDLDKIRHNKHLINVENIIGYDYDYEDAILTSELRILNDERTVIKVEGQKTSAWINKDYIKEFNNDAEFKVKYFTRKGVIKIQAVTVYESDELVGLILPVNV